MFPLPQSLGDFSTSHFLLQKSLQLLEARARSQEAFQKAYEGCSEWIQLTSEKLKLCEGETNDVESVEEKLETVKVYVL